MPLLYIKDIVPDVKLALWHLDETAEELIERYTISDFFKEQVFSANKSVRRRAEVITVRLLLDNLFGPDVILSHNKEGRPLLSNGFFISISHTCCCVAVIVSKQSEVSVDIESINNRVVRVANRFMRSDEKASETIDYLIHWCVKETLYKLYSDDNLAFEEMRVNRITGNDIEGDVESENLRRKELVRMDYKIVDNCVLTYAVKMK